MRKNTAILLPAPIYPNITAAVNACCKAFPFNSSDFRVVHITNRKWTYVHI